MTEPCHDVAHPGHVEVYSDRFEESLAFYTGPYGLKLSHLGDGVAYLRAWDDCEFHTLKRTRHHTAGVGHIGYRIASPAALERRLKAIEASGYPVLGWTEGDAGHGPAFRFADPFGHVFELYWALLHKPGDRRISPFRVQTHPTASVTGIPSAVKPFSTATRTWSSAT
ncbi:MAG: VOC family protein [Gemmobacter sp.]